MLGKLRAPYVLDFHAFGFGPVGRGEEHLHRVVIVVFQGNERSLLHGPARLWIDHLADHRPHLPRVVNVARLRLHGRTTPFPQHFTVEFDLA